MRSTAQKKLNGFTLIELLVVITVLGILAALVLVAVNPLEQFSRGRDSARQSTVTQLGRAIQSFYTSKGSYPVQGTTWISNTTTGLFSTGELKSAPINPAYSTAPAAPVCTYATYAEGGAVTGYCYQTNGTDAIVYVRAESTLYNTGKCGATTYGFFVYSTADGRAGLVCRTAAQPEPAVGAQTFTP